jgi:Uma2 family endonuclease
MLRAMASAAQSILSVEDYLRMSFEGPSPDYVDGELVKRGEPVYLHSKTQGRCFRMLEKAGRRLFVGPEMRLRVGETQIRIADLAAFQDVEPTEQIPSTPPFIVIEVVSPDDRYIDIHTKLEQYRKWGVPHVWLVDPWLRKLHAFTAKLEEVDKLEIPELGISMTPSDLFD